MEILLINGPNLNLLELRDKTQYGDLSYNELVSKVTNYAKSFDFNLSSKQSNSESEIINIIHKAITSKKVTAIIINAGAYTHTSIAILDALNIFSGKVIEVHLSDISKREDFRKTSYISYRADALFKGEGLNSYYKAIDYLRGK